MAINSEVRFFMTGKDEEEFLHFALDHVDSLEKESDYQWHLCLDGYRIQLLRSQIKDEVLVIGRIALRTREDQDSKNAEKIYRKLGRWIKGRYTNSLLVRNVNNGNSTRAIKDVWLAPDAAIAANNNGIVLGQNSKAIVVFEINES